MHVEPTKEHKWLQKIVGEWTIESHMPGCDGQEATTLRGTETVRPIGDLWIVGSGEGEMPCGTKGITQITIGYDTAKGHFVGTWVGSMMTHMWVYKGHLDEAGRILTLEAEGPSFMKEGETAIYRDVITLVDDDTRKLTAQLQQEDGSFQEFMSATFRRKV